MLRILCILSITCSILALEQCLISYDTETREIRAAPNQTSISAGQQGRAGKRGPSGPPGPPGPAGARGPQGPKGEVPVEQFSTYTSQIQALEQAIEGLDRAVKYPYHLSPNTMTWQKAKTYCESKGMRLATAIPTDMVMYSTMYNRVQSGNEHVWIGLSDLEQEGNWTWIDGTPATSSNTLWGHGQPDGAREMQDCGVMREPARKIDDLDCDYDRKALCEKI